MLPAMRPVLWIDAVGLSLAQVGEHTPHLAALADRGSAAPMSTVLPAVTCSAQATMLTGRLPRDHGVVGNGWYWRDLGEVLFWRQANSLPRGEKVYETARRLLPGFTCAKLFWWWNMGAAVDWSVTPRPYYPADGRKIPAVYGWPKTFPRELEAELGTFPFFDFWGPRSGLASSRWLTDAALRVLERQRPGLTMVYLPHLDYDHQRHGPRSPQGLRALAELDDLIGELVAAADAIGAATVVVSEYALEEVERPIALNRVLREEGLCEVRDTPAGEILDPFGSRAFCVADHQLAHVYVREPDDLGHVRRLLEETDGVAEVLDEAGKQSAALDHANSGELVVVCDPGRWFSYYYWLDDARAPDFAPTVDIHRKPGYDPAELFTDPRLRVPALRVARRLAQKKLGMRYLMDVIPLSGEQVCGSHGRLPASPELGPVFLCSEGFESCGGEPVGPNLAMESVPGRILDLLGAPGPPRPRR